MYSSYTSFKYKMFAFDLGNIILYSIRGYSNSSLSSTNSFIDNILCTKSLVAIFARDYSFLILLMTHVLYTWHLAFSFYLYFSYLDIQNLLHGDLTHSNSSSVFALTMSYSRCLSVLEGLFIVRIIVQFIQHAL